MLAEKGEAGAETPLAEAEAVSRFVAKEFFRCQRSEAPVAVFDVATDKKTDVHATSGTKLEV